jgi:chromate transporter
MVMSGLIMATGITLVPALKKNAMGALACWALAAITFVAVAVLRVPLAWVILGVGGVGWAYAWHRLGARQS